MKNILATLLESQIEIFAKEFSDTSKRVFYDEDKNRLIHTGEFGMLRESCVRSFLTNFLPGIFGVAQGYVIGQNDEISHQCDLIIYHKNFTPYIHTPEEQRFFPIESVLAVGEIKSKIDGRVLDDALKKLTQVKVMKELITDASIAISRDINQLEFEPTVNIRDQLVTFIFCDEVTCTSDLLVSKVKTSWDNSLPRHRINMIASVKNGTYLYTDSHKNSWMYPTQFTGEELNLRLIEPHEGKFGHLALFIRYLSLLIEDKTVLYPELTKHLSVLLQGKKTELEQS